MPTPTPVAVAHFYGQLDPSYTVPLPPCQSGDLIVLHVVADPWPVATPAGWTSRGQQSSSGYQQVFTKVATANDNGGTVALSEPGGQNVYLNTAASSWRNATAVGQVASGVGPDSGGDTQATSGVVPATNSGVALSLFSADSTNQTWTVYDAATVHYNGRLAQAGVVQYRFAMVGASDPDGGIRAVGGDQPVRWHTLQLLGNRPPNAPIITSPTDGQILNKDVPNVFELQASDPDQGDSTSQSWWRHRLTGVGAAWTTVTKISPVTTYTFAAGTFAAGDHEVQAATRDASGAPANEADLKWSTSTFFTAATAPPQPIITDPVNGATIGQSSYEVVISTPALVASRWRTVADNAGNPDTSTILSAEITKTAAPGVDLRRHVFEFPVNNRTEHLQVQIQNAEGLWSSWASSRNPISYTPPAVPTRTLTDQGTSLLVTITNPAAATGEPTVTHNEVWVDDGDGLELRAIVATNGTWTYHTPRSRRAYDGSDGTDLQVIAVGSNGTKTAAA